MVAEEARLSADGQKDDTTANINGSADGDTISHPDNKFSKVIAAWRST